MERPSLFGAPRRKVLAYLTYLVRRDRANTVEILRVLIAVEKRRLYLPHRSLFEYCTDVQGMSEEEAYLRIRAARAAASFPVILDKITSGQLTLTSVKLLSPHLDEKNGAELLEAASGMSKRKLEQMLAERFPSPDLPTVIVPVTAPSTSRISMPSPATDCGDQLGPDPDDGPKPEGIAAPALSFEAPAPPARVQPLAPERFALQVTVSKETRDKLQRVQELLSHTVKPGDVAEVLDRALDALIAQLEKRVIGSTENPRPHAAKSDSDHIPLAEKSKVIARDGWQCSFPMPDGGVCGCRWKLQFHHARSRARGGASVASNLKIRCASHHRMETEAEFGQALVEGRIERSQAMRTTTAAP